MRFRDCVSLKDLIGSYWRAAQKARAASAST